MTYQAAQRRKSGRGVTSMRGRPLGGITAEGPVSVGVGICAPAGHANGKAEKPAAQAIAIRHTRDIAAILAHLRAFA